jgi:hypothetical protein
MNLQICRIFVTLAVLSVFGCLPIPTAASAQPSPSASPTPTPPAPALPVLISNVTPAGCLLMQVPAFTPVPAAIDRTRISPHAPAAGAVAQPFCSASTPTPSPQPTATFGVDPHVSPTPTASPVTGLPNLEDVTNRELPPAWPPQILRIEMSDANPHSNELLLGRVLTTTNVDAVFIRFGGFQAELVHQDAGYFTFGYNIPGIPFFMKRSITISVVAQTIDGRTTSVPMPLTLR